MFGVMLVGIGIFAAGAAYATKRWPQHFDEKTWPCERFQDRKVEDVPARCLQFFKSSRTP